MRIEREFFPFKIIVENQEDYEDFERIFNFILSTNCTEDDLVWRKVFESAKRIKTLFKEFQGTVI